MSDTAKRRLAIDLDEIERQLQQGAPQRGGAGGYGAADQGDGAGTGAGNRQEPEGAAFGKSDPLAELARIVGQDDPFRGILSDDRAGIEPGRADPDHDAVFDQRHDEIYREPPPGPAASAGNIPGHTQAAQGFDDWLPQDPQPGLRAGERAPAPYAATGTVPPHDQRFGGADGWSQMAPPAPAQGSGHAPQQPQDRQPPQWGEEDLYADPRRPDLNAPPVYAAPYPAGHAPRAGAPAIAADHPYDPGHPGYDDYVDYGDALDDPDNAPRLRRERRSGGKATMTIAAILGVAVLGVASALYFVRSTAPVGDGEPPLITAESEPMRVEPVNPGGVEIPDQDRQIFERSAEEETRVVDREEQPVDVGEIARSSPRVVLPPPAAAQNRDETVDPIAQVLSGAMAPQSGFEAPPEVSAAVAELGEPRRVRTVTVRPDGTIIRNDDDAPRNTAAPVPPSEFSALAEATVPAPATERMPWETDPAEDAAAQAVTRDDTAAPDRQPERDTTAGEPAQNPARNDVAAAAEVEPAQPETAPTPPAPAPAPRGPMTLTGAMQIAPQAQQQQQRAPAQSPQQTASVAPTQPVAAGDYVVQLGISSSEDRARAAFDQYQSRYSGIIGGANPIVRQAEVNGNTIYRVRVGPYDLSSANSVCDRIKNAGGDCFVARN